MGYGGTNQYRVWNPENNSIHRVKDVIFNEKSFYKSLEDEEKIETMIFPLPSSHQQKEFEPPPENQEYPEFPEILEDLNIPDQLQLPAPERNYPDMISIASDSTDPIYRINLAQALLSQNFQKLPQNYQQAINDSEKIKWKAAIDEEFNSLKSNNTWELISLPQDKNLVRGRWVYAHKYNDLGEIIKFKARWVAKGFEQLYGQDYDQTFAAVIKPMSYKLLFAISAVKDWEIQQMDVKTAFLHSSLEEEVYTEQPHGYQQGTLACKLNKALYGLKQSPRVWYNTLKEFLEGINFQVSQYDQAMFYQENVIITAYVDDLLIFGLDLKLINSITEKLNKRFEMKDMGAAAYFLGIQISRDRKARKLKLSQSSYLTKALELFDMQNCKPTQIPLATGTVLEPSTEQINPSENIKKFQSIIGTLMYAMTGTGVNLVYSVSKLAQYTSNPSSQHWAALKRLLRYVKGTLQLGLIYSGKELILQAFSDSDWAGDKTTRKSTGGYVFKIAGSPISWSSKRQKTIALSSCEAEYMALTQAAKEAIWIKRLMEEIKIPQSSITLYCDNQGAIALSHNPEFHVRTKHIDIAYHFIRNVVQENTIKLVYISTEEQAADGLTKALSREKFQKFLYQLGVN